MTTSHLNGMTALSQALAELNRLTGYGENPTVTRHTTLRGHTTRSRESEGLALARPLARTLASGLGQAATGGKFQLSQGQIWGDIASALNRAGKRYL